MVRAQVDDTRWGNDCHDRWCVVMLMEVGATLRSLVSDTSSRLLRYESSTARFYAHFTSQYIYIYIYIYIYVPTRHPAQL